MIEKRFIYLLIGLSVASLGFYWWHASNKDKTPTVQKIYRVPPIPDPKTENGTGIRAEIEQDEKASTGGSDLVDRDSDGEITVIDVNNPNLPFSHPDNVAARLKLIIARAKSWRTAEELAKPEIKRYYELMESEEYLELVQNGATLNELMNFLANNGLIALKDLMYQPFRQHFPNGNPMDYEPEMREKLKSLFIEKGTDDPTVFETFLKDQRTFAWYQAHFGAHLRLSHPEQESSGVWLKEVKAEALHAINASVPNSVETGPTPKMHAADTHVNPPIDTQPSQELLERESTDAFKDSERELNPSAARGDLPEVRSIPELLTHESIVNMLHEQFSPQRFNTAIQTLNRYGPEEGLRRLKESDPGIAKQVERFIQKNQEND